MSPWSIAEMKWHKFGFWDRLNQQPASQDTPCCMIPLDCAPRNGSLSPEQWMATEEVPKRFRSFFGHICLLQDRDVLIIFQVFHLSRLCMLM